MRAAPSALSPSPRVDCKHTHTHGQTHKHVTLRFSHPRMPKYSEDSARGGATTNNILHISRS